MYMWHFMYMWQCMYVHVALHVHVAWHCMYIHAALHVHVALYTYMYIRHSLNMLHRMYKWYSMYVHVVDIHICCRLLVSFSPTKVDPPVVSISRRSSGYTCSHHQILQREGKFHCPIFIYV